MRALVPAARAVAFLALVIAGLLWFDHLRARPDIRAFDPDGMAISEAAMWRSYYEGRWVQLGWQAMRTARTQYGFSMLDSLRLAKHAAVAALRFRGNTDDPSCLPELEAYYNIVRRAGMTRFDATEAAMLELEWWKQRRRSIPPEAYARNISKLAALLYDTAPELTLEPSTLRAQAMAYRDTRRDRLLRQDEWQTIEGMLAEAYGSLKTVIITDKKP